MARPHFADELLRRCRDRGTQVVVGLDPRFDRLPADVTEPALAEFGPCPRAAARAFRDFNRAVIGRVAEHVVAVKVQVAFYEQLGCAGMEAYAETLRYAREKGLLVIGDVKRNDIAATAAAYAAAHLGGGGAVEDSDDFVADAITVNPYLGGDGVRPFLEAAAPRGRGVFVLVRTSNPSAVEIQDLDCGGEPLCGRLARLVDEWGAQYRGSSGYSALGAVVGATFPDELVGLRRRMPHAVLLVPGFGAQGAGVADVAGAFDADGGGAVVNASRSVIFAWERPPYSDSYGPEHWHEAVAQAAADMRAQIWAATH